MSLEVIVAAALIGVGAAGLMDLWSLVLRRGFGVSTLDYALLGRWIGHFPQGRFVHERIAAADPVPGERPLGWLAHYAIGVTFAVVLVAFSGPDWLAAPTLLPALALGLGTIVAPWLVMQPAMGAGVAGSRSLNPGATRLRNLGTHAVYGIGLYASALVLAMLGAVRPG
ncbi:MAG TPA: DUF2938 domain-containing protein [Candidatus Limnocylindrales bacterium]|nr:DUF2938 domain-containing protein [Candidatus Limnocylindrales bacterium]